MPSAYSREVHSALLAIRENILLARDFVRGQDRAAFEVDTRTIYAVTRCLEIISEASRRLTEDLVSRHPHLQWAQIRAAGNVYRHRYDNVSPGVLWTTVTESLSDLERMVDAEIDALEKLGSYTSRRGLES